MTTVDSKSRLKRIAAQKAAPTVADYSDIARRLQDYSDIARSIERTIAKGGKPLTEAQYMLMTGALAVWLDKAEARIKELEEENKRRISHDHT